jgi:hypothetical protein
MPQDAATQAQLAYQQQAVAAVYPHHQSPAAVASPAHVVPSSTAATFPEQPAGSRNTRLARMEDRVLVTRTADEETEDGRIRNKEAMVKIRDAWVYKQIRARMDEFTEYKQVCTEMSFCSCRVLCQWLNRMYVLSGTFVLWDVERQCQGQR